jgi:hypothetical protein
MNPVILTVNVGTSSDGIDREHVNVLWRKLYKAAHISIKEGK